MPIASAAISSSRMAESARPNVDDRMFATMMIVRIAIEKIQKKFVIGVVFVKPVAPPTAGMLRMITRMISPKPSVTIAR